MFSSILSMLTGLALLYKITTNLHSGPGKEQGSMLGIEAYHFEYHLQQKQVLSILRLLYCRHKFLHPGSFLQYHQKKLLPGPEEFQQLLQHDIEGKELHRKQIH